MKNPTHYFTVAVLVAIVVLGCVTPRPVAPTAKYAPTDDLKARIDSAVKDRRNWVDPAREF
jgi:hypothetical protein